MLDAQDVMAIANDLQWDHFSLLAHSMGVEISAHLVFDQINIRLCIAYRAQSSCKGIGISSTRK
jgi:hypothetical protein